VIRKDIECAAIFFLWI